MKKYRIAFEQYLPGLAEHTAPLVRECLKREQVAVTVTTPDADGILTLSNAFSDIPNSAHIEYLTYEDAPAAEPFDALYSIMPSSPGPCFTHPDSPTAIPRIAATHGLTDKRSKFPVDGLERPLGYFNVLFATGPAMFRGSWEAYLQRHPETADALRVFNIGAPKTDAILNGPWTRDDVLRAADLDPARPTVLYAPTFQKEASLERHGIQIIETLAALDINLIIRLHHYSLDMENQSAAERGHQGKDWRAILDRYAEQHPNLRHVTGDSNPWFVAADILVGDVSGACYEYILQDKPVIFIDAPDFFEKHGTDGIGYWGRYAGEVIADITELASAVQQALDHPEAKQADRQKLINDLIYNPGRASKIAVDTILGLVAGDIPYPVWGPQMALRHDVMFQECIRERLAALHTRSVALFGAGQHTHKLLHLMRADTTRPYPEIKLILDDAPPPSGTCAGIPVCKPDAADPSTIDTIILSSDYFQDKLRARCAALFAPAVNIIDLYAPFPWHRPG